MKKHCLTCGRALPRKAARYRQMCATCRKFAEGTSEHDPAPLTADDVYPGVTVGVADTPAFAAFVADGLPDGVSVADYWRRLEAATHETGG